MKTVKKARGELKYTIRSAKCKSKRLLVAALAGGRLVVLASVDHVLLSA